MREPYNYLQARQLGCHIITIPPPLIEKIEKFGNKSFTQLTKETVKGFLVDSIKSSFKIFQKIINLKHNVFLNDYDLIVFL